MPNYTTNLNLVKPLVTEQYDIAKVTNDNADIIDDAIHDLDVAKVELPTVDKVTPIDADSLILIDIEASNVVKKWTLANIKTLLQEKLVSGTNIKTINGNSLLGSGDLIIATTSDWNTISATLTYASADSPTFVANTSVDLTSVISVGMKIKLTQTTVKYFIVTAITSTTITLYGGTDYTLANATITLPYFSSMKAPFGFPLNPDKWSVIVADTTLRQQTSPAQNTWYNLGGINITIPIGLWIVSYKVYLGIVLNAGSGVAIFSTLSTTNNGQNNVANTMAFYNSASISSTQVAMLTNILINLSSKQTHYINTMTDSTNVLAIQNKNDQSGLVIKAVCAYL